MVIDCTLFKVDVLILKTEAETSENFIIKYLRYIKYITIYIQFMTDVLTLVKKSRTYTSLYNNFISSKIRIFSYILNFLLNSIILYSSYKLYILQNYWNSVSVDI